MKKYRKVNKIWKLLNVKTNYNHNSLQKKINKAYRFWIIAEIHKMENK